MNINQLFDVKNKVVLVTGGGRGVGKFIAEGFVRNGAKVYICSRKEKNCKQIAEELSSKGPGKCDYIAVDLSKMEGIDSLVTQLKVKESKLDVLVNNSGATWGAPFDKFPEAAYDKVMDLNLKSIFFLTQKCLPLLKAAASKENPVRVINIGSVYGILCHSTNTIPYDVSKAGVHHMSKVMGATLSQDNINVNAIALGMYQTDMTKGVNEDNQLAKHIPIKRCGDAEEIAGTCLFLSSRAGGYITGTTIEMDGGMGTGFRPQL